MKVEMWAVDRPVPYDKNPRQISPEAVAKVARLIKQFGWRQPIVVDTDGVVIVGHTRLLAAEQLGLKTVPVHIAEMTAEDARAYRIADNRVNRESTWDDDLLRGELFELDNAGVDLALTAFDPEEWDNLFSGMKADAPGGDDAPGDDVPGDSYSEQYGVIVTCQSEAHQQEVYEKLHSYGFSCRVVTT